MVINKEDTLRANLLKLLIEDPNSEEVMLARGYLIQTLEEAISKGEGSDLLKEFLSKREKVILALMKENEELKKDLRTLQDDFYDLQREVRNNPFFTENREYMDEAFEWMMERYQDRLYERKKSNNNYYTY